MNRYINLYIYFLRKVSSNFNIFLILKNEKEKRDLDWLKTYALSFIIGSESEVPSIK